VEPAASQTRRLGHIDFPNSGASEAQKPFITGVLLLHSFEFEDAAEAFRRAERADPDFALAYWGEAMTYNHPLWKQQDAAAARAALGRLAPTAEARRAKAPTPRERGYLSAVETLYGRGTKAERDHGYMDAMRRLSEAHPDDLEARAFYALSILGSRDGERDFATYMRAAAVAQSVFQADPEHPGAAHYLIHSFDDPIHAPLGLPAARAYSRIAPDAAHAQHMTSHIFLAMGMWSDVVAANIRARDVQNAARARRGLGPNVCGHYTSWLEYGFLMQGRLADAAATMDACHARIGSGDNASERGYFADMRARYVLDTGDWAAADRWSADLSADPRARADYLFTSAYAAIMQGDAPEGRRILARLTSSHAPADGAGSRGGARPDDAVRPRERIQAMEIEGLLAMADGRAEEAIETLRRAVALEESLPFAFGPPATLKPPHELLGELQLQAGHPHDAVAAFRTALERTPLRANALRGLAEAAEASEARARLNRGSRDPR